MSRVIDPRIRFDAKVALSNDADGCHVWTAATNEFGYGILEVDGRSRLAHRWIMQQLLGRELLPREYVLHHCDNPPCVNPDHLYVGSQRSNMRDCIERGRFRNVIAETKAARTHCNRGHEYTEANTWVKPGTSRRCRTCDRINKQEQRRRKARAAA